jgi:hypothetical protein
MWVLTVPNIVYAGTRIAKVVIPCSPTVEKAGWKVLRTKEAPPKLLSLVTTGIEETKEAGEKILLTRWDDPFHGIIREGVADILARCLPSGKEMQMFPVTSAEEKFPLPRLDCLPTDTEIEVRMFSPNNEKPIYKYLADLWITTKDPSPEQVVSTIPPATQAMAIPNPTEQLVNRLVNRVGPPPIMVGGSGTGGSPTK